MCVNIYNLYENYLQFLYVLLYDNIIKIYAFIYNIYVNKRRARIAVGALF